MTADAPSSSFVASCPSRRAPLRAAIAGYVWGVVLAAASVPNAAGQTPAPALSQDEVDLQGRLNILLGSGARALGMGGAFLARPDDATAASWNPAGLSYLLRPEVTAVWMQNRITIDSTSTSDPIPDTSHFRGRQLDFGAVTFPLHSISGAAQLSYQRVIPFAGTRTIASSEKVAHLDASGGFDVLALGTGWRVTPTLRVGATLNHWMNGFHQVNNLNRTDPARRDTVLDATFGFRGWNTNLGVIWSPIENLNIGAVVKTPFTGRVHLAKKRRDSYPADATGTVLFTTNESDRNDLRLDFPSAFGAGASWRVASALTVSADYTHTNWSHALIHNFYVLSVTPQPPPGTPQQPPAPQVFDSLKYPLLDPSQNDAQQIRMGAEYVFIHKRLKFPLRAGYIFDQQFFQAQGGHAPVFGALTLGTGILAGPVLLDFAYVRELGKFTDTDKAPTRQMTYRIVASAIYRLGSVH